MEYSLFKTNEHQLCHVYLVEGTKFEVKTTVRAIATDNTIVRGDPMILWYFWM